MTPENETKATPDLPKWTIWLMGILVVAVSALWAITWGTTASAVNNQGERLRTTELKLGETCEKVDGIKESLTEIKSDLKDIKKSVTRR